MGFVPKLGSAKTSMIKDVYLKLYCKVGRNMARKFKIGDKVRVKVFKVKGPDDEGVENTMGKTGTIQGYAPSYQYPYEVAFVDFGTMLYTARELEKVE